MGGGGHRRVVKQEQGTRGKQKRGGKSIVCDATAGVEADSESTDGKTNGAQSSRKRLGKVVGICLRKGPV